MKGGGDLAFFAPLFLHQMTRSVSIVIPTHQRAWHLRHCLNTVLAVCAETSLELEVLTVHGPDDEESVTMVRDCFPHVRAVQSPVRNLSAQRNLGAREATGEVVVYLDDDAWPREGWLEQLVEPLDDPQVAAVGGVVLHPDGTVQLGQLAISSFGTPLQFNAERNGDDSSRCYLTGGNVAVRKSALMDVGGYDENFTYHLEDGDFSWRLLDQGYRVEYRDEAAIYHEAANGPHRRSRWDRDWRTVVTQQIYFAFQHVRRGRYRLAFVPALLQVPKSLRLVLWMLRGRLGPLATARGIAQQWWGVGAGYYKGLRQRPVLPLSPEAATR